MVKDIAVDSDPAANGTLYFVADEYLPSEGILRKGIWKSDGTAAGTVHVASFGTASKPLNPVGLVNVNGTVFFRVNNSQDETGAGQLWKTNGTAAGTVLVTDIAPGDFRLRLLEWQEVNGRLFFSANGGGGGYEIWTSDGTGSGTVRVADLKPGSASSSPFEFVNANGVLMFSADDGMRGAWTTRRGS